MPANPVAPTNARTAKPCGPGRRCYGQAVRRCARARPGRRHHPIRTVREARTNSAPGRARHKPSDHRAGKAVCWASPVCCCAVLFARAFSRSGPRVPAGTRPSLRPLGSRGWRDQAKLGRFKPRGREGMGAIERPARRDLLGRQSAACSIAMMAQYVAEPGPISRDLRGVGLCRLRSEHPASCDVARLPIPPRCNFHLAVCLGL